MKPDIAEVPAAARLVHTPAGWGPQAARLVLSLDVPMFLGLLFDLVMC